MLYSSKDPIEGDDDGDEGGEPVSPAGGGSADPANDTVTEHRIITRHARTGKILSNVRHPGFHGQPQPPRGGSLHPDGSMIGSSGKGRSVSGLDGNAAATGMAPAGGSSKPGAMGPAKDGRARIGKIVAKFSKI